MRCKLTLVTIGGVYAAESVCIAPAMPGPYGCSVCSGDELQGSSCVRAGRWFTCSSTIQDCCSNPELANSESIDTCVSDFSNTSVCDKYVARSSATTNKKCQQECKAVEANKEDPAKNSDLQEGCMYQHFEVVEERVVTDGVCFNNWVHGYSEPQDLSGYKIIEDVQTPALCQSLCQEDPDCVRFLWSAKGESGSEYDKEHRCHLKNQTQVEVPAAIVYTSAENPPNFDPEYCNVKMSYECWTSHYSCNPCNDDKKHCIWHSDHHVAGWKFCPDVDSCQIPGSDDETSTAAETSTHSEVPTTTPKVTPTEPVATTTPTTVPTTTPIVHLNSKERAPPVSEEATTKTTAAPTSSTSQMSTTDPTSPIESTGREETTGQECIYPTTPKQDECNPPTTTQDECNPRTTNPCDHHEDPPECVSCEGNECHNGCKPDADCDHASDCKKAHGVALRIHDRPRKIRIAIDN